MFQRQKSSAMFTSDGKTNERVQSILVQRGIPEGRVLKSVSMIKPLQIEKSNLLLGRVFESAIVSINENGSLKIGDMETSIEAANFLYGFEHPKTSLHDADYG